MNHDNPAARLHKILVDGTTIAQETGCRKAWGQLLDCNPHDNAVLFQRIGKVMQLSGEAAEIVQTELPHQSPTISLWLDPINTAFLFQNFSGAWHTFAQHINQHCVAHLGLTADLIGHKRKATMLEESELVKYENIFSNLREEIAKSATDDIVKRYLDAELTSLIRAISEYRIAGGGPILKEVEALFGHLVRDTNYRNFLTNEDLGRRLLDQLTAMANLVTVAVGLPQLTVVLAGLIPK